jgi:hypothetical protein
MNFETVRSCEGSGRVNAIFSQSQGWEASPIKIQRRQTMRNRFLQKIGPGMDQAAGRTKGGHEGPPLHKQQQFPNLALTQWRHGDWNVVRGGANSYAALACIRWYCANTPCGRAFCRPKHVAQHATRRPRTVRCDILHE